jgi:tetratricopeptide (TPR) repeat protein
VGLDLAAFGLILVLTFIAYLPAVNGTMLWDDENHITRPALQSLHGLWRIWFEPGATYQYYPLLYGAFWLEHQLWGDATTGYHILNIVLHVSSAWLVVLIVRRLEIPGAWLAGAVFALHPVCVESVAWIAEQKSTLSGVFYLASALLYFNFDKTRRRSSYIAAFGLFLCAILSKSVTATLPAALLVVLWWKRGRLEVKRDISPLSPWLALGVAAGLWTAWLERYVVEAEGAGFAFPLADRSLLAGRVPWHYLLHILWPVDLSFLYRRFTIDSSDPIQYLLPAATLLVIGAFLILAGTRRVPLAVQAGMRRAPLAAALLFVGTLVPVLGFLNVYPFLYSWVADHFGYLASLAVIVPLCSLLTLSLRSYAKPVSAALLAVLGFLTWNQSHNYSDIQTLWEATVERTPSAWMAHYNLAGLWSRDPERRAATIAEFRTAIRYKPDLAAAHADLADQLKRSPEDLDQAFSEYEKALCLEPLHARTHYGYGMALLQVPARLEDAISELEDAVRLDPAMIAASYNLASVLSRIPGRMPDAIARYRALVQAWPNYAEGHYALALALYKMQSKPEEVIGEFENALRVRPDMAAAHSGLAAVLSTIPGRLPEAIAHLETAQRLDPDSDEVREMLNRARAMQR